MPIERSEVTLEMAIDYYLCSSFFLELSESSKKAYQSELNQFKSFVTKKYGENTNLQKAAEPIVLKKYLLLYKHSLTQLEKYAFLQSFFRCVFNQFFNEDISTIKDALNLKWAKGIGQKPFTKVQLAELICLSQIFNNELRNFTILWVFLGSGIRLIELKNIKISDIDAENKAIQLRIKNYNKSTRSIKINHMALLILLDYIKFKYDYYKRRLTDTEYNNLYIFSTDDGRTAINIRTIHDMIKKLINEAITIPESEKNYYCASTFRHNFAIYGLEGGIDIYVLSRLLGHESINSTTVYSKLTDDQVEKIIENHPLAQAEKIIIQKRLSDLSDEL